MIREMSGHAFVLVFSVSSKQSLTELKPIIELINEIKGTLADLPMVLVGNKNDDEAGREVAYTTGETLQVRHIRILLTLHLYSTRFEVFEVFDGAYFVTYLQLIINN